MRDLKFAHKALILNECAHHFETGLVFPPERWQGHVPINMEVIVFLNMDTRPRWMKVSICIRHPTCITLKLFCLKKIIFIIMLLYIIIYIIYYSVKTRKGYVLFKL